YISGRISRGASSSSRTTGIHARRLLHTPRRRPRPPRWKFRKRRSSQAEFLCDFRRAHRRAHLGELPVRLPELTLACSLVIAEPRELRTPEVYERLNELHPNLPRAAKRVSESSFDLVPRLAAPRSQENVP